jgi:ElaB/YqjD/DUF883 family membrane-anchored ribosome-binding protein
METNQFQDKAQEWQGEAKEAAGDLRSKAEAKISDFKETAEEWRRCAAETSRKAAKATDHYVHENPWTVIASVAVASLLLGFLLGRSRD